MTLSLFFGVLTYILAQFLWYAPFGFGSRWRRYQKRKHVVFTAEEPVVLPAFVSPTFRTIILPAIIMSMALHVLRVVFENQDEVQFLLLVFVLWLLVVARKHFQKATDPIQRKKWYIEDGALLWSLLWVAQVVSLWWRSVWKEKRPMVEPRVRVDGAMHRGRKGRRERAKEENIVSYSFVVAKRLPTAQSIPHPHTGNIAQDVLWYNGDM